jgi:hypothetical protein
MLAGAAGAASAQQPASPRASCVALITTFETSQLPAGSVGREVSGLATSGPGLGSALVSSLAHSHLGSIETCSQTEG